MPIIAAKTQITVDGILTDWTPGDEIDFGANPGYSIFARAQGDMFFFRISAPVAIGANTTIWLNTDQNAATGFEVFGFAGGAEFNINFYNSLQADGTLKLVAALYSGDAGQTLILDNLQLAAAPGGFSVELAIPKAALGSPSAIDTLYDVNNATFLPPDFSTQPFTVFNNNAVTRTSLTERVGIVWSDTTAANYFSPTAYSDLFMAAETQAMQAGIPFDILTEADLTNLAKLANYDALIFPSFTNVQSSQVTAITNTLEQATRQFGIGLITSGDFMTNDQTGAALAGDPYARMKILFGATRVAGGNSGNVTINSSDTAHTVLVNTVPGAVIQAYSGVGWNAYQSVTGTGQTIATETVNGTQTFAAALATQTAGKNVLFSSNGVMADSNLLGDAISYVATSPGISLSLSMTRDAGIFATRMDMDQSQFPANVSPTDANGLPLPGIYDKLIPILQQWKTQFDFVGSYYVNLGDNPTAADPSTTNWAVSLPAYQAILAMGGEIGDHSYTHLISPPITTVTAHTVSAVSAGSLQVTLDSLPAFAGVTVGMVVTGANIGSNTPLPGAAGVGGAIANTTVTAMQANADGTTTLTLSYVPGGFGTANVGVLGAIPAGSTLTFGIPSENTNFLQTGIGTVTTPANSPFTYDFEFNQSKLALQQALGTTIYGAAVPGAAETYATSQNILQYFPSVAPTATTPGYTGYVTGGWTGVGSGYPSAFGYISPTSPNSVYIAPNMTFDFTEIQYQGKTTAQAVADWVSQMNAIAANAAGAPIFVLPIHDYGVTAWDTTGTGLASPYTTQMYTDILALAASKNYEFVTLEDLASRIQSFDQSGVTSTVSGNVITASVASGNAGEFALNVGNQGTEVIQNVANWYAYDSNSVFLPATGGNYTITLGTAADNVTHITALPMRGDLLSVTGDGRNLNFSVVGDGEVVIALGQLGTRIPLVTGATIFSLAGNRLELTLTGLGRHDVSLRLVAPPPAEFVKTVSFSSDTGASASDFVTNAAAQTISGTLSAALATGDVVKVSLDNGVSWLVATAAAGTTTFAVTGVTLTGSGTLLARVENADGLASAALTQPYVLDQTPPAEAVTIVAMTRDSGLAQDFITNDGTAGRTVSGKISVPLAADETLRVSFDGGATWNAATVTGTDWSAVDGGTHLANWTIETQVVDLAGNLGPVTSQIVTFDATPPGAPLALALAPGSDSGASVTDNITNVITPTVTGTAEAGSTVTLFDGATVLGSGIATNGQWTITTSALINGTHSITAKATDVAGNLSVPSAALTVNIDSVAPAAPAVPDLIAASDTGISSTDNITNIVTPTFTGTAEAGSLVTLFDGTTAVGSVIATNGQWTITTSALIDGIHNITANATDVAGNLSVSSAALTVNIDTKVAAPTVPNLTAASDNGPSNTDNITTITAPTFTGTAEAGSTVALFDSATSVGSSVATAAGQWTITASTLALGSHAMTARATDVAGNISAVSGALVVTIITGTGPVTPSVPDLVAASDSGVSNTDNITRITTPTFTGVSEGRRTITLLDNGTVVGSTTSSATGSWTITASTLTDGAHNITATAADTLGNVSPASGALVVTIDATPPAAPTAPTLAAGSDTGLSTTDNVTNIARPTFTGSAETGATVTLFDGANAAGTAIATNGVYTITTTNSPGTGVHSYTARATDVAGNVSLASDALAVTIDRTRPTAPTGLDLIATSDTGVSSTDNITQVTTPTITGAAVAGTLVKLFEGTTLLGSATTSDTGTWSIVTTALADGVHTLRATATDAAGNVSTNSNSLSVTVDNLAPAAPVLTTLNATRLAGTGPGAAGGTVTLFDGAATLGIAPVGPGGNWNWTFLSPLTNETHVFTAIASDAAGNVGAASGSAQIGTAGADTLTSTAGNDLLRGGGGGDTFVFAADFGKDIIADFRATGAAHDIINFHAVAPLSDFTSVLSHATQVGSNVVISPDGTNALTLSNVTKTSLIAGDFTFV